MHGMARLTQRQRWILIIVAALCVLLGLFASH